MASRAISRLQKAATNIKLGLDLKQTRLVEQFGFGITDPTFNPPCLDTSGNAITDPTLVDPNQCGNLGYTTNPNLQPGLIPFDLSRNGSLFQYNAKKNINQYAFYGQDAITFGNLLLTLGLRGDMYYGLTSGSQPEPRAGLAYNIKENQHGVAPGVFPYLRNALQRKPAVVERIRI